MKTLILSLLFTLACTTTMAEIVEHDDSSMNSDLGFALEQEAPSEKERDVASEEGEEENSERDVASENEGSGIQFWEYKGE